MPPPTCSICTPLREQDGGVLAREGRGALAAACFDFLPDRAALNLAGWEEVDIFAALNFAEFAANPKQPAI